MNYNEDVKKLFGKRHALDSYLTYSIQFVELAAEQVAGPCRAAQIPERLRSYISAFDGGLSHDQVQQPEVLLQAAVQEETRQQTWPSSQCCRVH